jgi:hypothetical protein
MVHWREFVKTVMNLAVEIKEDNFSTRSATFSFSRNILTLSKKTSPC